MSLLGKPVERQSLTEVIEARLSRAIVCGELTAGEKLTEPELASRLGVSRAPVREALIGLEFAGLVQSDERGRSMVSVMTAEDIQEIYQLRLALEPLAIQFAAQRMTPEVISQLQANIQRTQAVQTHPELAAVDAEFHHLIVQASGMPRLCRAWQCIRFQIELWLNQMQPQHSPDFDKTRQKTIETHTRLVKKLSAGDDTGAAEAMRKHIVGWLPIIESTVST
jgi:DNA-binding GntR family transcriptional regulator